MSHALSIVIEHLDAGSKAGQTASFDGGTVALGRRPDLDVAFDADKDLAVSGRHAELKAQGDKLILTDLGSSNGTFVNDNRISKPTALQPDDVVRLGDKGPTLRARLEAQENPTPETVAADTVAGDAATIRQPQRPGAAPMPAIRPFGPQPPAPGGPAAPPAATPAAQQQPSPQPPPQPTAPKKPAAKHASPISPEMMNKSKVGMHTLMNVVHFVAHAERRRVLRIVIPFAILAVVATGLILTFVVFSPAPDGGPNWAKVVERVEPSVYVVLIQSQTDTGSVYTPTGTAWSVAPGKLATNAHVAALFNTLKNHQSLLARSSTSPPHDLRIQSVTMHPGYESFDELNLTYFPVVPGQNKAMRYPASCDVALLHIHEDDHAAQSPPLPLADRDTLSKLAGGDPVMYVGFPMEGIAADGVDADKPQPGAVTGSISKITDPFISRPDSFEDGHRLTYDFEVAGGASGSAVFNRDGKVIGFVAGGNVIGFDVRGQRIMGGGTSFGPRADLVGELLDDTATEATAARRERWQRKFRTLYEAGVADPQRAAQLIIEGRLERVDHWTDTLDAAGKAGAKTSKQFTSQGETTFFLIALAHGRPVKIHLETEEGNKWAEHKLDKPEDHRYFLYIQWKQKAADRLTFRARVWADESGFAATDVSVYLFKQQ